MDCQARIRGLNSLSVTELFSMCSWNDSEHTNKYLHSLVVPKM